MALTVISDRWPCTLAAVSSLPGIVELHIEPCLMPADRADILYYSGDTRVVDFSMDGIRHVKDIKKNIKKGHAPRKATLYGCSYCKAKLTWVPAVKKHLLGVEGPLRIRQSKGTRC